MFQVNIFRVNVFQLTSAVSHYLEKFLFMYICEDDSKIGVFLPGNFRFLLEVRDYSLLIALKTVETILLSLWFTNHESPNLLSSSEYEVLLSLKTNLVTRSFTPICQLHFYR